MSAAAAMALVSVLKKRNGNNSSDAEQPSSEDTVEGLLTLTEEARALVRALQDNDISEEELLRMVNTEPSDFHADNPERAGIIRRARKIFRYLDINNDGVVAPDDLQEVKGRLYQATDPQTDTLQKLRTEFMRNGEAVDAMRSKAKEYLVHREGYALCFGHLAFFAIFIAVLALQLDTSQTWEVRRAITQSVFPSAIFGEDVTMINSIVLTSTDEITDWFEAAFVNSEGVFADPACGDGECSQPLEYAVWRDTAQQTGCEIDCGRWAPETATVDRKARIELFIDPTLSTAEVNEIRWNLVCPTVRYFNEQLRYYQDDQTVSASETNAWTVFLFDCDWELRLHAPQGGVSGQLSFAAQSDNSTEVTETGVENPSQNVAITSSSSSYTYAWAGCDAPLPSVNEILGTIYICTDNTDFFFNRTGFSSIVAQAKLESYALQYLRSGVEQYGLVSYHDVAPTCNCAGPQFSDCNDERCPSYIMQTDNNECPALCEAGQTLPADGSAYVYPGDVKTTCEADEINAPAVCGLGAPGWDGGSGPCVDCHGCSCDDRTHWLGDGFCDNGEYSAYFNCGTFSCDDGDCMIGGGPGNPPTCADDVATDAPTTSGYSSSTSGFRRRELQPAFDLPCTYTAKMYDLEDVVDSVGLKMSSFVYNGYEHPQCVGFQLKVRTANDTVREFIETVFYAVAENSTGTWIAREEVSLANVTAVLGDPSMMVTASETVFEPVNSTCNTSAFCLLPDVAANDIVSVLTTLGHDGNPCELLSTVYGCETDGCGCPYPSCTATSGCLPLGSCDKYPWDSCETLEEDYGCDCTGCACTAGDDCPRTCFGMTCSELVDLGEDDTLSYYLANPAYVPAGFVNPVAFLPEGVDFKFLEDSYGCNCEGCGGGPGRSLHEHTTPTPRQHQANFINSEPVANQSLPGAVLDLKGAIRHQDDAAIREILSASVLHRGDSHNHRHARSLKDAGYAEYYSYYYDGFKKNDDPTIPSSKGGDEDELETSSWPLDTVFCDEANQCSLTLLLNGVCDRACATESCGWDFNDCCSPTFSSSTTSLDTRTDSTIITLRINNNAGATPYDAWDTTNIKRFVANNHRLVGGVLFDQKRQERANCSSSLEVEWAETRIGQQVVDALTEDATCPTGSIEFETAGTDPTFQVRSELYNDELDVDVCHPTGLNNGGFPFVRFPSVGLGKPLRWGATITAARNEYQVPGFFDTNSLDASAISSIEGGYPIFFDCGFDYERAIRYLDYMHDGYYLGDSTTTVDVKFLLYNQDLNLVTFVKASFAIQDAGSLLMEKSITIFNPTPYDGSALSVLRLVLELAFVAGILASLLMEIREAIKTCKRTNQCFAHFRDAWNLVDMAVIVLQFMSVLLWVECLTSLNTASFSPRLSYDVYDINPDCPGANLARFNNSELTELRLLYSSAEHFAAKYTFYSSITTVVFILMTLQLLHVLHFQPKLSLITRTMGAAWDDLAHLFMLFFLVELSFALLGHVIYGSTVEELSTLGSSVVTLLLALFGAFDIGLVLGELYGFQGYLFYFLYMAIAFLLLMNMLLAILVDAYITVKAFSDKADGVVTDIYRQTVATKRALKRPKTTLSNQSVVDRLEKWLEVDPPPKEHRPTVALAPNYDTTDADLRRVLRLFLQSEHGLNKQYRGVINPHSTEQEIDELVQSIMYHYSHQSKPPKFGHNDKIFPTEDPAASPTRRSAVEEMRRTLSEEKHLEHKKVDEKSDPPHEAYRKGAEPV